MMISDPHHSVVSVIMCKFNPCNVTGAMRNKQLFHFVVCSLSPYEVSRFMTISPHMLITVF